MNFAYISNGVSVPSALVTEFADVLVCTSNLKMEVFVSSMLLSLSVTGTEISSSSAAMSELPAVSRYRASAV